MKILLVEDSERLRLAIRTGLANAGYAVDAVPDGRSGLSYARKNPYDLIILDIMLPGLDGLSVLRSLRQDSVPTHVLLLTAKGSVDERVEGLRAGADDYLVKPFDFEELLARVEALVRRAFATKAPVLEFGDLRIETASRRVSVDGHEVALTQREYRLLNYLAHKPDVVVSRIEIEDHIYHEHALPSSNAVDSAVCSLRAKLKAHGYGNPIETVRGEGYLFAPEGR
ncbi:MAG: response regulator transcription factor [Planctomycetota bacterium]